MATRRKTAPRAPLMESDTEAALRRRGSELVGLVLIVLAGLAAALIWSYSPDDPSLFSATDEAPKNALGLVGASLADPLHRALGWGAYGIAAALGVWGLRLVLHTGEARALRRSITLPVALFVAAAFAATHVPPAGWPRDYGLGGLLGDATLANLISLVPLDVTLALRLVSVVLAAAFVFASSYALGVTWAEARGFLRFLGLGSVVVYAGAHKLTGRAASGAVRGAAGGARAAKSLAAEARSRRAAAEPVPTPAPRTGGIPRFDPAAVANGGEDGVLTRIREAVRARAEADAGTRPAARVVPPLTALRAEPAGHEIALLDRDDEPEVEDEDIAPARPLAAEVAEPRVQPARRSLPKSARARREEEPELGLDPDAADAWTAPPLSLLQNPATIVRHHLSTDALETNARMLESVLDDYGVRGEITSIRPGPVVTMYELEPAAGLKASRVIGLSDDIARSMSALACRCSTIPGRSVIGIELPNELREKVLLREILASKGFGDTSHALPLALGKDIGGEPVVANLARMPHLLIAGTTGSGKSVAINTMILSLLYKLSPAECRLIMIDPKMLELSVYDGIPHLLSPVVTDPKKAVVALKWVVAEMEERYRKMSKMGVRNIDGYNARVKDAEERGEAFTRTVQTGFDEDTGEPLFETESFQPQAMPFIVVIVDEMADLMMVAGKEIEACIQRLAQMARASGIHLIMATQRPSVDVITGTIKANFPTRISFQVTSKIDSRTILGEMGAEQLLGQGDMLYMAGGGRITRVHGPFVSDEEVEEVVRHLKTMGAPEYEAGVLDGPDADEESEIDLVLGLGGSTQGDDALYDQAVAIVAKDRKCSTSYLQRKLSVGYNKAAKLVEMMEDQGVVSQANHVGKREVLVPER
ncbi:MAG: DNA translocase FtsK 4TM domain-containing protein [Amaricoccus sp.]|uniref:DNA translocase FtsK n=1 Tax=Amaricoccus sp. TaxID=1872485 RepID=UPI0039E69415